MTTNGQELTEQIAQELYYSEKPEERHRNGWNADHLDEKWRFWDLAAAVLPILRRAQIEAWENGRRAGFASAIDRTMPVIGPDANPLPNGTDQWLTTLTSSSRSRRNCTR